MKHITQKEWIELLQEDSNAVILDVRTAEEQAFGIIENAICLDIFKTDEFLSELEKMDKTKNYYVYCKSGGRSANACVVLEQMGAQTTYNLLGGVSLWEGDLV
jgi:rhodanese-related sulfurtransferase